MSVAGRRALLALAAVVTCAALIVIARGAADAPATSDSAVIESYTLLASEGRLLVGAYSRFQWHHPGPLYFFLIAPFYALSGDKSTGLNAGAVAVSIAAMAIVAAVLMRRRPALAMFCSAALVAFAWRASEAVASPWNPHVTLLPGLALIVAAADVIAGRATHAAGGRTAGEPVRAGSYRSRAVRCGGQCHGVRPRRDRFCRSRPEDRGAARSPQPWSYSE